MGLDKKIASCVPMWISQEAALLQSALWSHGVDCSGRSRVFCRGDMRTLGVGFAWSSAVYPVVVVSGFDHGRRQVSGLILVCLCLVVVWVTVK